MSYSIDLTVHKEGLKNAVEVAKKRNIVIPTFKQMKDPEHHTPAAIKEKLKKAIKDGLSEDLEKDAENDLQKLHDKYIKQLEGLMDEKEKEIMTV